MIYTYQEKPYLLYILVFSLAVYELQGILYPIGSFISQSFLIVILLIGLWCFLSDKLFHSPFSVKVWALFFIMNVLYFIFSPKEVNGVLYERIGLVSTISQFKNISVFCLVFFATYMITLRYKVSLKIISVIGLLFFVISVMRFYYDMFTLLHTYQLDAIINNAAYFIIGSLVFFPFIVKRNKVLAIIIALISIYLVFLSAKKGAVICLLSTFFIYLFYYLKKNMYSISKIFLILLIALGVFFFIYHTYYSSDFLITRIEIVQDEGIGARNIGYWVLWNHWLYESSSVAMFFGNGSMQSVAIWGNYAHSDWLELLIDNGLLGVIIYIVLFISLGMYYKKVDSDIYKLSFLSCLIIWFIKSIFSMGYTDRSSMYISFMLGIIIANCNRHIQLEKGELLKKINKISSGHRQKAIQ